MGSTITGNRVVALVAAVGLAVGVYVALQRSKTGRALRSLASNPASAPLVGIDVVHYSAIAFAAGGALAAIAGILLSTFIGINPTIGGIYTIKALIVVTMGGIGNVLGGLLAGFMLGMAETFGAMLLDPGLITAISFALFGAVLLWRPQGLLGGSSRAASGISFFRSVRIERGLATRPADRAGGSATVSVDVLAVADDQHSHVHGARDGMGVLLGADPLHLVGRVRVLRAWRVHHRSPGRSARILAGALGRRRCGRRRLRRRRPDDASLERHVLRDLHIRACRSHSRAGDVVGVHQLRRRPGGTCFSISRRRGSTISFSFSARRCSLCGSGVIEAGSATR